MNSTRITALLSGLGLLATWFASTPPASLTSVPVRLRAAGPQASRSDAPLPVVQVHTDRLRGDADRREGYSRPHRNPFEFAASLPSASDVARHSPAAAVPTAVLPELPPPPPFTLAGLAEDATPSGPVRTAVLVSRRDVFLVHEGDVVEGRYKVAKIGANAVELVPVGEGTAVLLRMK